MTVYPYVFIRYLGSCLSGYVLLCLMLSKPRLNLTCTEQLDGREPSENVCGKGKSPDRSIFPSWMMSIP